jgi:hypothetical protein
MKVLLVRLLVVLMAWAPYQIAQAGMIGTDRAVVSTSSLDRAALSSLVSRADVSSQLQSFGIDQASAQQRIAAMSDDEVRSLQGKIDSVPAGASSGGTLLVIIIIVAVIWWAMGKPGMK